MLFANNITKLFWILIIGSIAICQDTITNESDECLIHNFKYRYEYLYHSSEIDKHNNSNAYICPLAYINDFNRLKWKRVYVNQSDKVNFYLTNEHDSQYLCVSNKFNLFKTKQFVFLSSKLSKSCVWKLEYLLKGFKKWGILIWNVEYKKPLYAGYLLPLFGLRRRNLYLWNKKFDIESDFEFWWSLDCRNGPFLLS
jgi:hypothetical protein